MIQTTCSPLLPCLSSALLITCFGASHATAATTDVQMDGDDIGGVVTSAKGPEAGVWVIAETDAFATRYAKIVVTDDQGRYLVPDLPAANYKVWVRGYGLADSAKSDAAPGKIVDLELRVAPDAAPLRKDLSRRLLVRDDEVAAGGGSCAPQGRAQRVSDADEEHGLRRLPPDGQSRHADITAVLGKFDSSHDAWVRRIQSGQAGGQMARTAMGQLNGVPIKYLADWTDRIAKGELPASPPPRPAGAERNVVATVRDWSDPKAYMHDLSGTDRRNPTVNAKGKLYGAPELSTDNFPILDPVSNVATTFKAPVRDADTPTTHEDPVVAPSPYWGEEAIWDSKANAHNPMLDHTGRVWYTARIRGPANPDFCKDGAKHPSAKLFPTERSGRHLAVYDPKTEKYTFIDTCYSTHHLQFAEDANHTLWTSGGGQVVGWLDTKKFDETGDAAASQGWAPHVVDTNGNGKLDKWTEPNQPADPKLDTRLANGFYAVMPNPADGSVWGSRRLSLSRCIAALRSQDDADGNLHPAVAGLRSARRGHRSQWRRLGVARQRPSR